VEAFVEAIAIETSALSSAEILQKEAAKTLGEMTEFERKSVFDIMTNTLNTERPSIYGDYDQVCKAFASAKLNMNGGVVSSVELEGECGKTLGNKIKLQIPPPRLVIK
jgi:hypothetical protein